MCAIALLIEAKTRKWLEDNSETTTNGFFLFDTSIIQWWEWMKQYHHKNINSSINGDFHILRTLQLNIIWSLKFLSCRSCCSDRVLHGLHFCSCHESDFFFVLKSRGLFEIWSLKHGFKDVVQEIESEVSCKLEQGKPGMSLHKRFITSLLSLYLLCFQFSPEG